LLNERKIRARRALLTLMYPRLAALKRSSPRGGDIRRVLVMRPDHLGDLLFATPALEQIRQALPEAHIAGLVAPWGRAMWERNPNLDSLHAIPFPGIAGRSEGGPLAPYRLLGRAARRLARGRYDLAVMLRFDHWWGAALVAAAGIPRRWGYDTPGMAPWLSNKVRYVPGRHEVEQDLRVVEEMIRALSNDAGAKRLEPLHVDRCKGEPPLRPPPAEPFEGLPRAWEQSAARRAIIHPGTGAANKLWTISGWASVTDGLAYEGWDVMLTGSPGERALTEAIVTASASKPPNLAGQTANLGQLTWALGQANLVLGVDNGPLHIAAALGRPTLHLYGPSDETIWGPWGDPSVHRVFRAPGARPSMRLEVGSPELEGGPEMRAITPEMVMAEIRQLV
jgi:ADP-heptose:LPS heptosyltransferase